MKAFNQKMSGKISLAAIFSVVFIALGLSYLYADQLADKRAEEKVAAIVDGARQNGANIAYGEVDASLFNSQISITNVTIKGEENEADIDIQTVLVDVKKLQKNSAEEIPRSLSVSLVNGYILIKKEMIDTDEDVKLFADNFGDTVRFGGQLDYEFDPELGTLDVLVIKTLDDFFQFKTSISLSGVGWLADDIADAELSEEETAQLMSSTLNDLSVTLNNFGGVEKIRAISAREAGMTVEELIASTTESLVSVQQELALQGGQIFVPMIDEVIKFVKSPGNIMFSIDPETPLDSGDFMSAAFGGEVAIIQFLEKARFKVMANQSSI